jgi:hypothetical protein
MRSIAQPVMLHSHVQPNRVAIADPASVLENVTYRELRELIGSLRTHLQSRGVAAAERIALSFDDRILLVLTALALFEIGVGAVAILKSPNLSSDTVRLVTDRPLAVGARPHDIQIGPQAFRENAALPEVPPGGIARPDTYIVFPGISAATADDPHRPLSLNYQALAMRIVNRSLAKGGIASNAWLGVADARSEPGFLFILECLWFGRSVVLGSSHFDEDIQTMDLYEATALNAHASETEPYFGVLKSKRGLGSKLRAAVISGTRFDQGQLNTIKSRVSVDIRLVLDSEAIGPFAVATYVGEALPRHYSILPGVDLSFRAEGAQGTNSDKGAIWVRPGGGISAGASGDGWLPTGLSGSLAPNGMLIPA